MLLHEFHQIQEDSNFDPGIRTYLTRRGYRFLGQGVDQMAFREPSTGQVLKIFGTDQSRPGSTPQHNENHKMFFVWAKFCMANQDNPFLPKFSGFESFVWKDRTYLQIRQELLKHDEWMGVDVSNIAYNIEYLREHYPPGVIVRKYMEPPLKEVNHEGSTLKKLDDGAYRLLVKTLTSLYDLGQRRGWLWDLHSGNVMSRAGTPVIVDPWFIE
jgi:hypothetical protein